MMFFIFGSALTMSAELGHMEIRARKILLRFCFPLFLIKKTATSQLVVVRAKGLALSGTGEIEYLIKRKFCLLISLKPCQRVATPATM